VIGEIPILADENDKEKVEEEKRVMVISD